MPFARTAPFHFGDRTGLRGCMTISDRMAASLAAPIAASTAAGRAAAANAAAASAAAASALGADAADGAACAGVPHGKAQSLPRVGTPVCRL
eukprot:363818-Chlamydomonas_euryale.AAC.7